MSTDMLKQCGLRQTAGRKAVLDVLEKADTPLTAEQIHALACQESRMGLSTTYRVLSQLAGHGLVLKNDGVDGFCYYQIHAHTHRHTLHCTVCGAVVPIDECPLAALEERLSAQTGFTITGHSLSFTGICPKCKQSKEPHTT
ncbi:MAG: transcriptional repressor [Butyricicoccus pullicaecorum]|nr:transcriptional repressor [Butyricicoccus pullicaecorum]